MSNQQNQQENEKGPLGERIIGLVIVICICLWLIADCAMPSINKIRNGTSSGQGVTAPIARPSHTTVPAVEFDGAFYRITRFDPAEES